MRLRSKYFGIILGSILLFFSLSSLKALPYSTSLIENVELAEEEPIRPDPDFTLGSVRWEVSRYAVDPKLEYLRDYYRKYGGGQRGLAAAQLVAKKFASQSPIGEPSREFFDQNYNPAATLLRHVRGEAGHCVTRAGLISAVMLSVGIPARVVQVIPVASGGRLRVEDGHNILEVWDERFGWSLLDPAYGGVIGDATGPYSAARASRSHGSLEFLRFKNIGNHESYFNYENHKYYKNYLTNGFVMLFPEPWLYLRSGRRTTTWLYRGRYLRVGRGHWQLGPAQSVLRTFIYLDSLAIVMLAAGIRPRAGRLLASLVRMIFSRPSCRGTLPISGQSVGNVSPLA